MGLCVSLVLISFLHCSSQPSLLSSEPTSSPSTPLARDFPSLHLALTVGAELPREGETGSLTSGEVRKPWKKSGLEGEVAEAVCVVFGSPLADFLRYLPFPAGVRAAAAHGLAAGACGLRVPFHLPQCAPAYSNLCLFAFGTQSHFCSR